MDDRKAAALQQNIDNGQLRAKAAAKSTTAKHRWQPKPGKGKGRGKAKGKGKGKGSGGEAVDIGAPAELELDAVAACVPIVGIDFGKVICGSRNDDEGDGSLFFSDRYLEAPMVPGARDGVSQLVQALGARRVFVVSKARQRGRQRTLEWLANHDFYDATSLPRSHVFFCNEKDDKAIICAALGITAFIDDSVDVLTSMPQVPQRLLLLPLGTAAAGVPAGVSVVRSWEEVCASAVPAPLCREDTTDLTD